MATLENVSDNIQSFWTQNNNEIYFERTDYANQIIKTVRTFGGSYSLFQLRRKGKTSFLVRDLAKVASDDFFVFYFSFMQQDKTISIENRFKKALIEFALEVVAGQSKQFQILPKNKTKFDFSLLGQKMSLEQQDAVNISLEDIFSFINHYRNKPILFLLDEFQEVATDVNEGFVRTLRTELDIRQSYIHCIFTGSSYYGLEKFFSRYNSPFFRFGTKLDFQDLGIEFIEYCHHVFYRLTQKHFDVQAMLAVFNRTGKFPSVITDIMRKMMLTGNLDPAAHLPSLLDNQHWETFRPLEQAILIKLAHGEADKLGKISNYSWFEEFTGKPVTRHKVNYALKKLQESQIVVKKGQHWQITNADLKDYVRHNY